MLTIEIAANNITTNINTNATTWGEFFTELANKTGLDKADLCAAVKTYDGMVVIGKTDDMPLEDHKKFVLNIELPENSSEQNEADTMRSTATINFYMGGDSHPFPVHVTGEHTRVRDVISDTMAHAFNRADKGELEAMSIKINDINADLDTELRANDEVCFCIAKAGIKGCGESIRFSVISRNGSCVSTSVCREKLEELGVKDVADLKVVCEDMCVMELDFAPNLEITSINGISAAESDFILQMDINAVNEIGFHEYEYEVLDLDPEALDEQEDCASDEEDYAEHAAHAERPVAAKKIKIFYGADNAEFAVVTNRTTVYDVLTAEAVQSIFRITDADLKKLNFSLDGVTVSINTVITENDDALIINHNAGCLGC